MNTQINNILIEYKSSAYQGTALLVREESYYMADLEAIKQRRDEAIVCEITPYL